MSNQTDFHLQIRKTSLVLFGHSHETRKRSISESYAEHPIFKEEFKTMSLQEEIEQLKETIKTRDDEIVNLKREIHKLKVCDNDFLLPARTNLLKPLRSSFNLFYFVCLFAFDAKAIFSFFPFLFLTSRSVKVEEVKKLSLQLLARNYFRQKPKEEENFFSAAAVASLSLSHSLSLPNSFLYVFFFRIFHGLNLKVVE